ncbi:MAG TPA: sigma 54-interacting transcriptional regulator [Clostridiales bacterium]|nr:sigma 54-interacting transcriptional regulator [Clostridiales bacterium]
MENVTNLSREDLLRILNQSFDQIFITDAEGVVVYVNAACLNHYGQRPEKMIGKRSREMTEQNLWWPRLSPLAQRYKKRLTRKQISCTGVTMLTTASPVFNHKGEVDFVIENIRDVTKGRGIAEELEESEEFFKKIEACFDDQGEEELEISNFIAYSQVMRDIIRMARRIAEVNSNVLITGDSGTGKSVISRYIHDHSPRKGGPFIEINCAALPESLIESELFGYVRGAFSGAAKEGKKGLIRAAENGTLFLDEIGELPTAVQAKLLKFIQDSTYFEVGGTQEKHANCRIVAATNRNLPEMVDQGKFRQDLYYRLKVFEINIPPLIRRKEDIIPLLSFFLKKYNTKYDLDKQISMECVTLLNDYSWPGNVRELANTMEQLVVMSTEEIIAVKQLPSPVRNHQENDAEATSPMPVAATGLSYKDRYDGILATHKEQLKKLFASMYREFRSSRKIADVLKISQSSAYRALKKYCPDILD